MDLKYVLVHKRAATGEWLRAGTQEGGCLGLNPGPPLLCAESEGLL